MIKLSHSFSIFLHFPGPPSLYFLCTLCSKALHPGASLLPAASDCFRPTEDVTKNWRTRGEGRVSSLLFLLLSYSQQCHLWWLFPCGRSGLWSMLQELVILSTICIPPQALGINSGFQLLLSGCLCVHHSVCPPGPSLTSVNSLPFKLPCWNICLGIVFPARTPDWHHIRINCF